MKLILFCVVGVLLSISALAEQVAPEIIVKGSIESVQKNDLNGVIATVNLIEVAKDETHPHDPEAFIELLKTIDVEKIKLQKSKYQIGEEVITVNMIAPLSLEFKLLKEKRKRGKPAYRYRIASVHLK